LKAQPHGNAKFVSKSCPINYKVLASLLWPVLHTSMGEQQKKLNLSSVVHPPYKQGPDHVFTIHPPQVHNYWSS